MMTPIRHTLGFLALAVPAVLALAACQAPQATTPSGKGVAVVKARLAQPDRRVQTVQDRPLKASDIRMLRLSLVNQTLGHTVEQDVASPGAEVAVAFRALRTYTDYVIEARAFTSTNPAPNSEVAYATAALRVDNELDPTIGDITLTLDNKPFDAQMTATGIAVIGGDYVNTATTSVRLDYDMVSSVTRGGEGFENGAAAEAQFRSVSGLAEADGKLYIADPGNQVIRMYDPVVGDVSTAFGSSLGNSGHQDDPTGTGEALFYTPSDVVSDGDGNLYVSDRDNHVIRQIELATGKVTTLVGIPGVSGFADSPASPTFGEIEAIAYASDALYIADTTNHTIRMVDLTTKAVTTIAGAAGQLGTFDTAGTLPLLPPTDARFYQPKGIAVRFEGGDRYIYVADTDNHRIRRILTSNGETTVSTLAGDDAGDPNTMEDGVGAAAGFRNPMGLTFDGDGNLVVADYDAGAIRKVTPQGRVTTYVGTGWSSTGYRDGPQRAARLGFVREVFFNGSTLFFYDANQVIRKVE